MHRLAIYWTMSFATYHAYALPTENCTLFDAETVCNTNWQRPCLWNAAAQACNAWNPCTDVSSAGGHRWTCDAYNAALKQAPEITNIHVMCVAIVMIAIAAVQFAAYVLVLEKVQTRIVYKLQLLCLPFLGNCWLHYHIWGELSTTLGMLVSADVVGAQKTLKLVQEPFEIAIMWLFISVLGVSVIPVPKHNKYEPLSSVETHIPDSTPVVHAKQRTDPGSRANSVCGLSDIEFDVEE